MSFNFAYNIVKVLERRQQHGKEQLTEQFFLEKLAAAKVHFERALDCKHTEFDDLYPYMIEHPQFFGINAMWPGLSC